MCQAAADASGELCSSQIKLYPLHTPLQTESAETEALGRSPQDVCSTQQELGREWAEKMWNAKNNFQVSNQTLRFFMTYLVEAAKFVKCQQWQVGWHALVLENHKQNYEMYK